MKANPIQMQKYLKGMDYPAKKQDLIKQAKKNKADNNILDVLDHLPEDEFETPAAVNKAAGKIE